MGKRCLASNRSRRATCAILALLPATLLMGMGSSTIGPDEVVVFYPTAGYRSGDGWSVPIHGVICKPKDGSRLRAATIGLFRRLFSVKQGEGGEVFSERARPFLVDNQRGKAISVRLGAKDYPVGQSGANGHFRGTIRLGKEEAGDPGSRPPGSGRMGNVPGRHAAGGRPDIPGESGAAGRDGNLRDLGRG